MNRRFTLTPTALAGVAAVTRKRLSDARGFLERMFCAEEFELDGTVLRVVQINRTFTAQKGAVRGMHFQHPPHAETKLVTCTRGAVYDVAVDLRAGSPSFLKWHGEELSADNCKSLLIPEGCAHGYQCLTDNVELVYLHSAAYAPEAEAGVSPRDPRIAIDWPLPIAEMSAKDASRSLLASDFPGMVIK